MNFGPLAQPGGRAKVTDPESDPRDEPGGCPADSAGKVRTAGLEISRQGGGGDRMARQCGYLAKRTGDSGPMSRMGPCLN